MNTRANTQVRHLITLMNLINYLPKPETTKLINASTTQHFPDYLASLGDPMGGVQIQSSHARFTRF
jgi:hypothetical protein